MNEKEYKILKVIINKNGSFSRDDLEKDLTSIQNLISKGYLYEAQQQELDENSMMRNITYYRATEKGLLKFEPFHKKIIPFLKENGTVILVIMTILTSLCTAILSIIANNINKEISEIEYNNAQPFLIISFINKEVGKINVQNAGGGLAKNIFFIKHNIEKNTNKDHFLISKQGEVLLAIASGQQGIVNLDDKSMDFITNDEDLSKIIPCVPSNIILDKERNWIISIYENIKGKKFISKFNGSIYGYGPATEFSEMPINCKI